jgi:phosphoesterase RecJ-like protein
MTGRFLAQHAESVALVADLLRGSERILVTTHRQPDGDALGALLGTARALRAVGKRVTPHTPDAAPAAFRYLPGFADIVHGAVDVSAYDLVIALDHTELARTGLAGELLDARLPVVAIDHHATADRRAAVVVVVPEAAATCELLADLLPVLELPVDAETATCLLTGLITDTGSFQHASTTDHVLATAGRLLELGADLRAIIVAAYGQRSLAALRIIGRALERLRANPETGAAISFVTRDDLHECGASVDDLNGVVNLLNTIPEASFSLLLTEYEHGKLKGSLRSDADKAVDVSVIAKRFGGGGHTLASGFEIAGRLVRGADGWSIE